MKRRVLLPASGTGAALVRVAIASNQPEAELVQSLLRDAQVPSLLRRTAGFDVPDFLAAGPRDVFVTAALEERAREALRPQDPGAA